MNSSDKGPFLNEDSLKRAIEAANAVKKIVDGCIPTVLQSFAQIAKTVSEAVARINYDQISKIVASFGGLIEAITNPQISTEEKERLLQSYKVWGSYGWAMPIDVPMDLFDNPPSSRKEANRIAMQFCKKKDIEAVFLELENMKHVRNSDLLEAKFCFDNRKYKACVMMLFSLIDARLIRLVEKEGKREQRPSGLRAAKKLIKHIQENYDDAERLVFVLRLANLDACYAAIFAGGDDFKKQVPIINRNFVDHGMRWKAVTKTDCVQVLLLLYETMLLFDFLKVKKMPKA